VCHGLKWRLQPSADTTAAQLVRLKL